ncbi:hypothetical protein SADUNF_Sadunf18G0058700 [Salix dunnii]|uniref:Non-haem dioxygenase N-terminal domain-containing protein n=1 Tax=Salix dunnii TaxID=1413687 RepID=A0A835J0U0_9ROSI|nr:hypothetical protein SADUNF_Sadunf18G0058700 [Salix dunnii]
MIDFTPSRGHTTLTTITASSLLTSAFNKLSVFRHHAASPSNRTLSSRITCETMSSSTGTAFPTLRSVTIPYADLKNKDADLSAKIEEGFGPNGLGILSISDVPGFSSLRQNLLHLSPRLANLPQKVKDELEDPHSRYNFGWSHGKEKLESGKPDLLKGSFYANPILDVPTSDMCLKQRYPSYCSSNIWPDSALPELEIGFFMASRIEYIAKYLLKYDAKIIGITLALHSVHLIALSSMHLLAGQTFKALGKLMHDVGLMVAYHCDQYVSKGMEVDQNESLKQILLQSRCHKGRLLYYFPALRSDCVPDSDSVSSWCGWHTDHGSLTGLTCAMFKRDGVEIPCPDSAAGLYIKTRTDQIVKVVFGESEIAYQIGETTEILSSGYLCATPHSVQAPKGEEASGVDRSTFALFMQPDWDERLNFPKDMHIHKDLVLANSCLTFGEYSEMLLDKYYHLKA